jgi:P27 family predicted phage terminase small subunit
MKTGRKPKPAVLKRLHGYPGHHTKEVGVEPEGVGSISAPVWFDAEQCAQWEYALQHAPLGLLTGTDREVLVVWVVACCEHARAVEEVRRLGQVVKTIDGNAIQNPYMSVANRQATIMLRAGAELGFSPAARASLGASSLTSAQAQDDRQNATPALDQYLARKPDRLN